MNETVRMAWLRIVLRVLSIGFLAAFIPWITLILLNAPILAPGSSLAPLLRFQPYNAHYESMMAAIYIAWAAMLWRASGNPAKHPLFIDFTHHESVHASRGTLHGAPARPTGLRGAPSQRGPAVHR